MCMHRLNSKIKKISLGSTQNVMFFIYFLSPHVYKAMVEVTLEFFRLVEESGVNHTCMPDFLNLLDTVECWYMANAWLQQLLDRLVSWLSRACI